MLYTYIILYCIVHRKIHYMFDDYTYVNKELFVYFLPFNTYSSFLHIHKILYYIFDPKIVPIKMNTIFDK